MKRITTSIKRGSIVTVLSLLIVSLSWGHAYARRTDTGGLIRISNISPIYVGYDTASPNLNFDGDRVVIFQDTGGYFSTNCPAGPWRTYAYLRGDHPNFKELYAMLLTAQSLNKPISCNYETNTNNPGNLSKNKSRISKANKTSDRISKNSPSRYNGWSFRPKQNSPAKRTNRNKNKPKPRNTINGKKSI